MTWGLLHLPKRFHCKIKEKIGRKMEVESFYTKPDVFDKTKRPGNELRGEDARTGLHLNLGLDERACSLSGSLLLNNCAHMAMWRDCLGEQIQARVKAQSITRIKGAWTGTPRNRCFKVFLQILYIACRWVCASEPFWECWQEFPGT